jgi:hypothetical protein
MRRTLAPLVSLIALIALIALATAAPAQANWFPAERIDGPAPIAAVGGVSLGRDGTGAVVYVKNEGDDPVGWVSRFGGGAWGAPERLPADGVSDVDVAAGEKGRLALAWIAAGAVYGAVADGGANVAVSAPVQLSAAGGAAGLDVRIGVEGGAYAVWSEAGAGGTDVRAAHLVGTTWTTLAAPLDVDPAHAAGAGSGRPRVAVAADDTAVVAWGETLADGRSHVVYRRLLGTALSQYPQEASVPDLAGEAGGAADSPEIDVEYDRSFAWVTFRQDLAGRSRTLMRRLRGSTFDPALAIDGGATSIGAALAMNQIGEGLAVPALADDTLALVPFADKIVEAPVRLDAGGSAAPQTPVGWVSERGDGGVAYRSQAADGSAVVRGRAVAVGSPAGAEAVLSQPSAGPVAAGSLHAGGDRVGDVAVTMLQGAPGAQTLGVALLDIPPSRPVASARTRYLNPIAEGITWSPGLDFLGPQTFRVKVDGRLVGASTTPVLRTRKLRQGRHRVQVEATDRRGQTARSRVTAMYVDTVRPRASASASRSGRLVTATVRASDPGRHATGVRRIVVDWGDGHRSSARHGRFRHRYAKSRPAKIRVSVLDRARNETVRTLRR